MRPRILLTRPVPASVTQAAQARFDAVTTDRNLRFDDVRRICAERDIGGLLMGGNLRLGPDEMAALPASVRAVASTSIGVDHIDLPSAEARGITVTNVPDIGPDCTADLTFMHVLMACRGAARFDALMRAGWGRKLGFDEMLGRRVNGARIGIVGMGRIGQLVARRAFGFDMQVHYTDIAPLPKEALPGAARYHARMDDLLPQVEVLTLHLPDLPQTRGILTAARIAALPRGAVVVNAGRGSLIDTEALISALERGHLAAAGLDTFADEPHPDPRLLAMPQVTLTPHAGSATIETRADICLRCLDELEAVLAGQTPRNPVIRVPA